MNLKTITAFSLLLIFFVIDAQAQKTWADVYLILNNTNCNSSTCHGSGASNPSFTVTNSPSVLYQQLINGNPINPYAKDSLNNKLVVPGVPERSFLLRKISHCSSGMLSLRQPFEGGLMPVGASRINDADLELIYNWIAQGASETAVIDPDTVAGDICDLPLFVRILPSQNISLSVFPNPAADQLTVSYTLERSSLVTMEIMDAAGKIVRTLFSETQHSGMQTNTFALETAPGLYFIRLTIGSGQYMKKLAVH